MQNNIRTIGAGASDIEISDIVLDFDTNDGGAINLTLPDLAAYLAANTQRDFRDLGFAFADGGDNAAANIISIGCAEDNFIGAGEDSIALNVSGVSGMIKPVSATRWGVFLTQAQSQV